MVHALKEIHRVLVPGGILLDLRPLADSWPVEILRGESPLVTGLLTDLPANLDDDRAANDAIDEVVTQGWFQLQKKVVFPLYIYWDNPTEMIGYITEQWSDFACLEKCVQNATQKDWDKAGENRRVRMKLKMLLNCLQKQFC